MMMGGAMRGLSGQGRADVVRDVVASKDYAVRWRFGMFGSCMVIHPFALLYLATEAVQRASNLI